MTFLPFKVLTEDLQLTCEVIHENHEYIAMFDLFSHDIYEAILTLSPSQKNNESYFRLCQYASLYYLRAKTNPSVGFRTLNMHLFDLSPDSVKTVAIHAVDNALANGITNL